MWTFYLNDVEVDEPIGWDSVEFVLHRSDEFVGLENIFSDQSLKFYGNGATIIQTIFEADGIDGVIEFKVIENCETSTSTEEYSINLITYNQEEDGVSVQIEKSDFDRKFKNRLEVPVNLDSTTALDGEDLSDFTIENIKLHSKEIYKQAKLIQNPLLTSIVDEHTFSISPALNRFFFPLQISTSELLTAYEISELIKFNTPSEAWEISYKMFEPGGDITVDYKLKGTLYDACPDNRSFVFALRYDYGDDAIFESTIPEGSLIEATLYEQTGGIITIPFDIEGSFTVPYVAEREILIYISLSNYRNFNTVSPSPSVFQYDNDSDNFLTFSQITQYSPSSARSFLVHEAFAKTAEYITGVKDCFRSDFFGRTNSFPNTYSENGCGAYVAISNGLNIRNMLQKDDTNFPIITSFQDLFNALNAVYNLGIRIELVSGKRYIRVEPKSYFFSSTSDIVLENPSNVSITPAIEYIYNEFEIGYRKFETEEINGIDEFNTTHNYSLPVIKAKKRLSQFSQFIAGGFAIEQTRRQQYTEKPTTDYKYDNDNFLICVNPTEITSDEYGEGSETYTPGTVSERNENFSSVVNVFSPETAYNLRLSPARMGANWCSWLLASLYAKDDKIIKFLNGKGNYLVQTESSNDCEATGLISENGNLTENTSGETPYFKPIYVNLSYPLTLAEFKTLETNSNKSIAITGCQEQAGFIKEVKYKPCEGMAEFKLLVSTCLDGEFDSSFDDSFDIGTC